MMDFDEWSHCILSNCGQYDSTPRKSLRRQIGDFRLRSSHGVDIAEMECRIHRIDRVRSGIRRDDSEYLFLLLLRHGQMGVRHNGRDELLMAGDCLLMDSTRTAELCFDGQLSAFASVHLPRGLCLENRAALPAIGRKLDRTHPLQASLVNLLDRDGASEDGALPADYLFDFVALMFRPDRPTGDATAFRDRDGRFRFACETVERHLSDPDFSIERLALLVHMSRRQLQRDFSAHGTTFTRFLVERRTRLVASHLRRGARLDQRPAISDLAFRAGFNDLSYFNRAFRQQFGMTPGDYHADCASQARIH